MHTPATSNPTSHERAAHHKPPTKTYIPKAVTHVAKLSATKPTIPMPISVAPPLPQEIVASLPPVSDNFTTNINIAKSVHHTVRAEVIDLFSALLRGTAVGTETSFQLLFMFPKAILGYKDTSAPSTALIRQRIIAWHAHRYAELWSEAKENRKTMEAQASTKVPTKIPHHAPAGAQTLAANARPSTKRALHLIEEGEYSKAIQALLSTGTVPKDQSAATKLQALHPEAPVPAQETETLLRLAETIEISEKQLVSAVRSFSSTTATGVLGIKVPLLKQMLQYDVSGVFTKSLRVFVVTCANGKTPEVMRPFLAGASLTGLPNSHQEFDQLQQERSCAESLRKPPFPTVWHNWPTSSVTSTWVSAVKAESSTSPSQSTS